MLAADRVSHFNPAEIALIALYLLNESYYYINGSIEANAVKEYL